jgi:8-oxo-dGTP pyrophosphatase MutT (NUDIX family)
MIRLKSPRIAVRGIILNDNRLLLVNAYPGQESDLWCAPGGGAEPGQSLPDNLTREVSEETGLTVSVGAPCLVNEFHDPASGFHQVDKYFRCAVSGAAAVDAGYERAARIGSGRHVAPTTESCSGENITWPEATEEVLRRYPREYIPS